MIPASFASARRMEFFAVPFPGENYLSAQRKLFELPVLESASFFPLPFEKTLALFTTQCFFPRRKSTFFSSSLPKTLFPPVFPLF